MDEHVTAPDPVCEGVGDRHVLDPGLEDVDVDAGLADRTPRKLDMVRDRVERDRAQAVLLDEPDRVLRVPRADVDYELTGLGAELREDVEQPLGAARGRRKRERLVIGPELAVELLDCRPRAHRAKRRSNSRPAKVRSTFAG